MAIEVRIPTILRTYTDGAKAVDAQGASLSELIDDLEANHPGIKDRLHRRTATCAGSSTSTSTTRTSASSAGSGPSSSDGDQVVVLPAVAGGCRRMTRYDDLLASVGGTPLVGLPQAVAERPTSGCGPSSRTATRPARSRTARRWG